MQVIFKETQELRCELVAITGRLDAKDLDLMPVSAARVSTGSEDKTGDNIERDHKLMQFLAEHEHMSPFEHVSATFLVEAPLFIARQWMRHRAFSYNEVSMRYTSDPAGVFWCPSEWRKQAELNLQCSSGALSSQQSKLADTNYMGMCEAAHHTYLSMLKLGVAREQARSILPVSSITRFYATANMRSWAHWYVLRSDPHAQPEIQDYAARVAAAFAQRTPETWRVLTGFVGKEG